MRRWSNPLEPRAWLAGVGGTEQMCGAAVSAVPLAGWTLWEAEAAKELG